MFSIAIVFIFNWLSVLNTCKILYILQKIPVAFSKHLKGCNQEHAILRRAGKKWMVKVNGRLLEEGWEKFAKEHDLQLGDCLVFKHEGNMEFEVSIFGSNHFEREYKQNPEGANKGGGEINCSLNAEGVNDRGEEINHTCTKVISQGLEFCLFYFLFQLYIGKYKLL